MPNPYLPPLLGPVFGPVFGPALDPVLGSALSPMLISHAALLLDYYTDMAQRVLESMQALSELNLQLSRDLIAEAGQHSRWFMTSKDASQPGAALSLLFNPGGAALAAYQRNLADLLSRGNADLARTAASRLPAVRRSAANVAEEVLHRASEETTRVTEKLSKFQFPGSDLRH